MTRNDATIIRTLLCMKPVLESWRIPASTIGKPVRPCFHACNAARAPASVSTSIASNLGFQFCQALAGH